jgi:hypothetical protein
LSFGLGSSKFKFSYRKGNFSGKVYHEANILSRQALAFFRAFPLWLT